MNDFNKGCNIINTIILGDCRELLPQILKNLDEEKIIFVSDPPYNIGYHYNAYKDNLDEDEYFKMLEDVFGGNKCVLIHYPEQLYRFAFQVGKVPKKVVSWVYNSNLQKQHRDIAFFDVMPDFKKVRQPYKENSAKTKRLMAKGTGGARIYDWWEVQQVKNVSKEKTIHPCQMPIQVMENVIGILPDDAIIIDPYAGSGTTLLAVKIMNQKQNANRKFIGVEIDPEYYKVATDRLNGIESSGQVSFFSDFGGK